MLIWQLCANLLIPNCLRSNLSYSPLAALELYVIADKKELGAANKMEIIEGTNIKQTCEKIIVDRLGRIIKVYKADAYD